jgi:D-glycero-D-manno-heptose 1,7-bisphosphate phosphatase
VEGSARPCAFFDRDGVLNEEVDYLHRIEGFSWTPGAKEALEWAKANGYWLVVATNQSGIGRGLYTEDDFLQLSLWLLEQAEIDLIYYCPHDPDDHCPARKPGTAMFEAAAAALSIDKAGSFMIGDRQKDLDAAAAFGIRAALYEGGSLYDLVRFTASYGESFP